MPTKRQWAILWFAACELESQLRKERGQCGFETDWDDTELGLRPTVAEVQEAARVAERISYEVS
jgi:hypothetical protein